MSIVKTVIGIAVAVIGVRVVCSAASALKRAQKRIRDESARDEMHSFRSNPLFIYYRALILQKIIPKPNHLYIKKQKRRSS